MTRAALTLDAWEEDVHGAVLDVATLLHDDPVFRATVRSIAADAVASDSWGVSGTIDLLFLDRLSRDIPPNVDRRRSRSSSCRLR